MFLGVDSASTFHGVISKVTILMRIEQVFSTIGIHYMAHKMNLVVQNLSIIPMVSKSEDILQSIYRNLLIFLNTILNSRTY
jgi:hypothetical protein